MSAPITEAHRELARNIMFYHTPKGSATAQGVRDAAQLIADSEARAVAEWQNSAHIKGEAIDSLLLECDQLRAEAINLTQSRDNWESACKANDACVVQFKARAERAERAEAELAAAKLLLNEETDCAEAVEAAIVHQYARAERAEAELAVERARLDYIIKICAYGSFYRAESRPAIDAAMKEGK